jgi:hypothetical protein
MWRSVIGFYRIMRANPLTFAGFVLVTIILVLAAIVAFAPSQFRTHFPSLAVSSPTRQSIP